MSSEETNEDIHHHYTIITSLPILQKNINKFLFQHIIDNTMEVCCIHTSKGILQNVGLGILYHSYSLHTGNKLPVCSCVIYTLILKYIQQMQIQNNTKCTLNSNKQYNYKKYILMMPAR